MISARHLFEDSLNWLKGNYSTFQFYTERDIVWTIQLNLIEQISKEGLPYKVFNDYGILPGKRRSLSTDIAILNKEGVVEVAVEFKYEPSHERANIPKKKFPVVFWGKEGVGKDIQRIKDFVEKDVAKKAYSIFIDEGGHFRHRTPHPGSHWIEWGNGVSVLYSECP
jgi:hypothetical protein